MTTLLHVRASPRGDGSKSTRLAEAYLADARSNNPDLVVDTLDVWTEPLPVFDGDKVAAKMSVIGGQDLTGLQKSAWEEIVSVADRFRSADRYVFSVPMWNGGIPYRLKQYIDIIHQPGLLWGLDPAAGYSGLLADRHATLVLTSGAYGPPAFTSPAFGEDHQSTYLRAWLNQAGITAIDEIRFQPTLLTSDPDGDLLKATQRARELAREHGMFETVAT